MVTALLIKGAEESLKYLDCDIDLLTAAFKDLNIRVKTVEGNKLVVINALGSITEQLRSTDTLIIYYTGHGVLQHNGISFKLDSEKNKDWSNYFSVNELFENTISLKTNHVVLIFDCCYATAAEVSWQDYARDGYILFLPSNKLEAVEEVEEYKASFFTYCIYKALISKSEKLYSNNQLSLENLYYVVKENALQYNREKGTTMPIPELIGRRSNEIVLGYKENNKKEDEREKIIKDYLSDFIYCVEKCDKSCTQTQKWCPTIFKTDINILRYVIPSIKEFWAKNSKDNITKIDAFFDVWFTKQDSYLGILGDMGVGKTSACVYLFYYLANKYINNIYTYVPVFISLNNFKNRIKPEENLCAAIGGIMNDKFSAEFISSLCHTGRMVFILDGFDEMSGDSSIATILHNYELLKPIMRFGCKTVLTCRTLYFSEQDQIEEVLMGKTQGTDFASKLLNDEYPFNIVELQEFTEEEILDLLKLLLPNKDNKTVWNNIGGIYDLRDLAKRAILLKMIVQTLPELQKLKSKVTSTTLYSIYTKKLLRREIESRKIGIELSEKERFIGYIANLMFMNDTLTIETHRFDKEIDDYFKSSVYSKDDFNNYNYDCKVSTFFSRDAQDNYRFMHKSFFEYYFALYCVQQLGEGNYDSWCKRWFSRETARFITGLLESRGYRSLIPMLIQISQSATHSILIWNTLHIISLLDEDIIKKYLTDSIKQEYVNKGQSESRCVIIRQYCRIIAKFIDRNQAEQLIDKIIKTVKSNPDENEDNDQTYYNYYGGKNAACQAFINHLSVVEPKYDAKLHLYLLEHLATKDYAPKIIEVTEKWINRDVYSDEIKKAVDEINNRTA